MSIAASRSPAADSAATGGFPWSIAVLVTAIAQTVVPALPALGFGREVGQRSAEDPSPLVPPGGFFSICGVIFAGALAFAIYQLRSAQRTDPLIQRVRPWAATAFFLNAVWIVVAQSTGIEIATLLILLGPGPSPCW